MRGDPPKNRRRAALWLPQITTELKRIEDRGDPKKCPDEKS